MKPHKIFLIRHAESEGNVNKNIYNTLPDWKVPITEKGKKQAQNTAIKLYNNLFSTVTKNKKDNIDDLMIYCSPWYRTRMTAQYTMGVFNNFKISYQEDPRLREQEWGNYQDPCDLQKYAKERDKYGSFFYRLPNGESGADVFDRIATFQGTLHRDFEKTNFAKTVLIFSHGLTIRVFLMRWFHWTVEEYEALRNPRNCDIIEMSLNNDNRYKLITNLRKKDSPNNYV